jgi:hypothetical protein
MLTMVFVVVPAFVGSLIWLSYHSERGRTARGEAAFSSPGRERWSA